MNWHIFADVWNNTIVPMNNMETAAYTALFAWVIPGYKGAAVLFMSFMCMMIVFGKDDISTGLLAPLVRVVLIASLLNVAFFNTVVRDVFQHTIPDGLIARFAAATGTNVNGTVAQVFDKAFVDAMAAGVKMADMQSGWSAIAFARAGFIYFIYLPLAALAIFATFAVVFVVMASLGLAVTVGPIFLAFLGFPATRRFFDAWLATIAGLGLLEGMAMLALGIMLGVETTLVKGVLTMNTNDADSGAAQIISLVAAVAVYALFAFELKQLQPLSVGMMSGAYQQLSGIGQRMMGTPIAAAGAAAASGAKAAAGAVGRSAGLISPPGRPARP